MSNPINPAGTESPLLAEHDSWLAFDPIRGCPNDCSYCFLRLQNMTHTAPLMCSASIEWLSERYADLTQEIPLSVPVSFGNMTDLLSTKQLFDYFCLLSSEIRRRDPNRLFIIITKARITTEMAQKIADVTGGNTLLFLSQSYASSLNDHVELGNISTPEESLESARIISKTAGLNCVHFWRPFLAAWNPPELLSSRIHALKDSGCRCSVIIGLKAPQTIRNYFSPTLLSIAAGELYHKPLPGDEYICRELVDSAISAASAINYPIFLHTSCALAFISGTPDINGTSHSTAAELRCRRSNCPTQQRDICLTEHPWSKNAEYIALCQERYGDALQIRGDEVRLNAPATDYEYNHLLHVFHRPPLVDGLIQNKVWRGSVNDSR